MKHSPAETSPPGSASPRAGDIVASVDRLSVSYGPLVAVQDVSFTVAAGQIVGLVGPNGAGKTSIVETVGGLRGAISGGTVSVCGFDPRRERDAVSRLVGMQLQESAFPSRARVGELCDLYEAIYKTPGAAAALLESYGLADRRHAFISELSGGLRQRLALALAQIGDVRLVLLDELTTGLDPEQRRLTWQSVLDLAARGVAVLLTSHYMDEVEALCGQVGVLRDGRLVAYDSPARITAQYGGESTFTVELERPDETRPLLDRLGLSASPGTGPGQVRLAGSFPDDYNRIVRALAEADVPASAVSHRSPTFEDAYLKLVAARSADTADPSQGEA